MEEVNFCWKDIRVEVPQGCRGNSAKTILNNGEQFLLSFLDLTIFFY